MAWGDRCETRDVGCRGAMSITSNATQMSFRCQLQLARQLMLGTGHVDSSLMRWNMISRVRTYSTKRPLSCKSTQMDTEIDSR